MKNLQPHSATRARVRPVAQSHDFRLGFVPMIDGAPVIVAHETGLFRKFGVRVRLGREAGWASIRDRLIHQEIVGAHAPASMAFALRCGLGSLAVPCLTAIVLAHNGSAITLSQRLHRAGAVDPLSLAEVVRRSGTARRYRFAAVFEYATQHANLRRWLAAGGLEAGKDVDVVLLPSPLVHKSLEAGYIDGYCVAEPWNSVAASDQTGWIASRDAASCGEQVEKVFLVLERFEKQFPDEHLGMVAALQEASGLCADPAFRNDLLQILSGSSYLDVSSSVLSRSLQPVPNNEPVGNIRFGSGTLGTPTRERGRQVFELLSEIGIPAECRSFRKDIIPKLFREDLYRRALERLPFPCPAGDALVAPLASQPLKDPIRSEAA